MNIQSRYNNNVTKIILISRISTHSVIDCINWKELFRSRNIKSYPRGLNNENQLLLDEDWAVKWSLILSEATKLNKNLFMLVRSPSKIDYCGFLSLEQRKWKTFVLWKRIVKYYKRWLAQLASSAVSVTCI